MIVDDDNGDRMGMGEVKLTSMITIGYFLGLWEDDQIFP